MIPILKRDTCANLYPSAVSRQVLSAHYDGPGTLHHRCCGILSSVWELAHRNFDISVFYLVGLPLLVTVVALVQLVFSLTGTVRRLSGSVSLVPVAHPGRLLPAHWTPCGRKLPMTEVRGSPHGRFDPRSVHCHGRVARRRGSAGANCVVRSGVLSPGVIRRGPLVSTRHFHSAWTRTRRAT